MENAVVSSNKLNMKLLLACRNLLKQGNIFYSPFSIASSLGMLYEGSRTSTKEEIEKLLSIRGNNSVQEGFRVVSKSIEKLSGRAVLNSSKILAVDKNYEILPEYDNSLKENYNVDSMLLDFHNDPEEAQKELNQKIESDTQKKINDLFTEDSIRNDTRIILANAVYFRGIWVNPFRVTATKTQPFYTSTTNTIMVDMMYRRGEYRYVYNSELRANFLEIPYSGRKLSMIVVLPKEKFDLSFVESNITVDKLNDITHKMKIREIDLSFPRFKLEESFPLKECLSDMGMQEAFNIGADFSGITGRRELYVSDIFHKAFVEITEESTEAAVATESIKSIRSHFEFSVDHPFMFFIREKESGLILFTGSVHTL